MVKLLNKVLNYLKLGLFYFLFYLPEVLIFFHLVLVKVLRLLDKAFTSVLEFLRSKKMFFKNKIEKIKRSLKEY